MEALPAVSWEGSAELAIFQSNEDPDLRITCVPMSVAGIWEAGRPGGVSAQLRVGAGPSFIAANRGAVRSLVRFAGSVGWRLQAGLKDVDCALEMGLDVLAGTPSQNILRLRVIIFTR